MTHVEKKTIKASTLFKTWHQDPEYVKEFKALEDEFELARLFIKARRDAGLTQKELATRMKTSQAYIARLESGRERPSTRTLNRFGKATGNRVVIHFEPLPSNPASG